MAKKRTTVSLDEDVAEYVGQDHINTSGLVNDLLRRHMEGGDVDTAIRQLRREQVKAEIQSMQSQLEQKQSELARLSELDNQANEITDDELAKIRQVPRNEEHPMIQDIADRYDMTPAEAIRRAYE
jgi:TolA-binding protein